MEQYILQSGATSIGELCRQFTVSISTIRRDVAELIRRNHVQKVYGGVARSEALPRAESATARHHCFTDGRQIGYLAASLVKEGMSVFLDSGEIALQTLPYLATLRNITVISHNLTVLVRASAFASLSVIALGGIYNSETDSFSGNNVLDTLSKMSIDLVFLTAGGITLERGLTSSSYTEIEVKRTVAKWNRDLVLLADGTEFGSNALITFCEIGRLRAIISDYPAPLELRAANTLRRVAFLCPQSYDTMIDPNEEGSMQKLLLI